MFKVNSNVILILVIGVILVLSVAPPVSADGAAAPPRRQVSKIRSWTAPDHTRVVLDMSSQCTYRTRVLTGPHRIVIDIPSGKFASGLKKIEVGDGVLSRIRINSLSSGAQIVLDVPRKTDFKHFALDPNEVHPNHRIVIDLKRIQSDSEMKISKERARKVAGGGDLVVIIDPGHGGSAPGTVSRNGIVEKVLALRLSKMIAEEIEGVPGFKAVLTREGDYDVGLSRRVQIARDFGGDCFVSVHLNGLESRRVRGSEVYFLSLKGAKDENAQTVAERENMILEMGEEVGEADDLAKFILTDMGRYTDMEKSRVLAESIAAKLDGGVSQIPFRGIKQANFVILRGMQKPSVLVEAAYITNRKDAAAIKQTSVQRKVAKSVASGIVDYLLENPPPDRGMEPRQMVTHTVSKGETLWGIARQYGLSVVEIMDMNGMRDGSRIRPGQRLRIIR